MISDTPMWSVHWGQPFTEIGNIEKVLNLGM